MPHSGLLLALAEGLKRHADADAADLRETWLCEVWQMRWRRMVWGTAASGAQWRKTIIRQKTVSSMRALV